MTSKNNFSYMMQEKSKRVPHYGLRKLSIGVASVLLGATLYLGGSTVAHADPVNTDNANQALTTTSTTKAVSSPTSLASTNQIAESGAASSSASAALQASDESSAVSSSSSTVANAGSATAKSAPTPTDSVKGTYSITTKAQNNEIKAGIGAKMTRVGINAGTQPGDVITITGDKGSAYKLTISTVNSDWGTVVETEDNNKITATITFKTSGSGLIYFELAPNNNYQGQDTPMSDLLNSNKNFTLAYDGKVQQTITLKQSIQPKWNPQFSDRFDSKANEYVFPGKKVSYKFAVNEVDGIDSPEFSPDFSPSNRVNSAVNYGTVITIPMPAGFVLDVDATKTANHFIDQTTITQQGNNVIINVPKGSGSQNYQQSDNEDNPYVIVGRYNFVQNADNPTHQASAPITITQKLNDSGTETLTWQSPNRVTEKFAGTMVKINVSVEGEAGKAWTSGLLPQNGQEHIVNYFSFGNDSDEDFTNGTAHLTFDFPDGLNVDKIKTPKLNGTTNYKYTMTLTDGTTQTGTVEAGQSVTANNGFIKKIEFTPDVLAANARTAVVPKNYMKDPNQADVNVFEAYGKVADNYSNGQPVKNGDSLVSSMQFSTTADLNLTGDTKFSTTQQVITPAEQKFAFLPYETTLHQTSGTKDAYLIGTSGNYGSQLNTIVSPIFYVVAPSGATFDQTAQPVLTLGTPLVANAHPRISYFMANGHEVAKIDLSDYSLNGSDTQYFELKVNSGANMLNGNYFNEIYVLSPKTKVDNSYMDNVTNHDSFDPAWVENHTANLYWIGQEEYVVNEANATTSTGVAKGNSNHFAEKNGSSLNTGDNYMTYQIALKNGTDNNLSNAQFVINLPQASDSSFHFQLNGGVDLSSLSADQLAGVTVKYSSQTANLSNLSNTNGDKFDEAGYVSADQINSIGGWSAVKSIIIDVPHVKAQSVFGNIALNGYDENLSADSNKTGTVATAIFADDLYPYSNPETASISIKLDNTKNENVTVTRTIIVTDPDGQLHRTVQTFTSARQVSKKDGKTNYGPWSKGTWAEFNVQTIAGYTPSQAKVDAVAVDGGTKDTTVNISYNPIDQHGEIQYVIKKSGQKVGTTTLTGKTGEDVAVNPVIPDGYFEDENQTIPASVKTTANGIPTVIVYVTLKQKDKPAPTDYTEDSLLIIEYKTADGNVLKEDTFKGKAGQAVRLNFAVPAGYHAVAALPSTNYTFTGHDDPIIIIVAKNSHNVPDGPVQPTNPQPTEPVQPTKPVQPTNPQPTEPVQPTKPVQPTNPQPTEPIQPTKPVQPTNPQPTEPVQPTKPVKPTNPQPTEPVQPTKPVQPTNPQPTEPVQPTKPVQPTNPQPTQPTNLQPTQPTSPSKPTQPKGQDSDNHNVQPTESVQPTQLSDDNQPVTPVQPKGKTTDNQINTDKEAGVKGDSHSDATASAVSELNSKQPAAIHNDKLPQTGNKASQILTMIGLSGLIAALDLVLNAKKRREN